MTGSELRAARHRLGLSTYELGARLRLQGDRRAVGQRIHEMETGERVIGGPTEIAVLAFLAGYVAQP